MNIYVIKTTNFKLDGGAMFGVVPKTLWIKQYPADENNLCNLSTRLLLIEEDNKKILINTGLGEKQGHDFFKYYYLNEQITLKDALKKIGFDVEEITDVILTHLHFDHCGGATFFNEKANKIEPLFKNAKYWVTKQQWEWALNPNRREKPSFLKENFIPIYENNQLFFIENKTNFTKNIELRIFNGHTHGLIVPIINYKNKKIVYTTDFFPTSAHIPISWVCGYDIEPLISMQEHEDFLKEALENDYIFLFEHDLYTECCNLQLSEKGIKVKDKFNFNDI